MGIFGTIIDILTTPLPRAQDLFPEGSLLDTASEMILAHNRDVPDPIQMGGATNITVRSQAPPPGVSAATQVATRSQQPMMTNAGLFPSFEGGGGVMPTGFDLPFIDIVPQGQGVALFRPGMGAGAVPRSLVIVPNPVTGKPTFFGNRGKPILYSGDFAAVRRVKRVAARASKSIGRRRR